MTVIPRNVMTIAMIVRKIHSKYLTFVYATK